jgi:hypothetical protein
VSYFDGRDPAPQETLYDAFLTRIEAARSRKTMLEMELDTAATGIVGGEVRVGVRINPLDTLVDDIESLMLVTVLFADSVMHTRLGSSDTGYAPVAVDVVGGAWGVPVRLAYATEFDTVVSAALGNWPQDRLGAAVFVQDTSTKAVLQTVTTRKVGVRAR